LSVLSCATLILGFPKRVNGKNIGGQGSSRGEFTNRITKRWFDEAFGGVRFGKDGGGKD